MHNKYQIHVFTAQRQILDIVYIDLTNPYQILVDNNHFLFKSYLAYIQVLLCLIRVCLYL